MAEERMDRIETAGGAENPGGAAEPITPSAEQSEPRQPMSFDEMLGSSRDYQSEFDRRLNQAVETARQNWEERTRQDVDEATRLARMTEAQRKEYLLNKDRAALDAERAAFDRERLQVTVGTELQKRGLSADFAPWLTGQDAETSQANIERFEALWNSSITAAVNHRMRSDTPPREPKPAVDYSKMSDEEYYAATMKRKD